MLKDREYKDIIKLTTKLWEQGKKSTVLKCD